MARPVNRNSSWARGQLVLRLSAERASNETKIFCVCCDFVIKIHADQIVKRVSRPDVVEGTFLICGLQRYRSKNPQQCGFFFSTIVGMRAPLTRLIGSKRARREVAAGRPQSDRRARRVRR